MIEIELPWPDKRLNPNVKLNRYRKAEATAEARAEGKVIAKNNGLMEHEYTKDTKFMATTTYYPPDRRKRDIYENMPRMMKAFVDGIFDCLELDDCQIKVALNWWGEVVRGGRVTLRLEEVGPKESTNAHR